MKAAAKRAAADHLSDAIMVAIDQTGTALVPMEIAGCLIGQALAVADAGGVSREQARLLFAQLDAMCGASRGPVQ